MATAVNVSPDLTPLPHSHYLQPPAPCRAIRGIQYLRRAQPHLAGRVVLDLAPQADIDEAFNRLHALVSPFAGSYLEHRVAGRRALSRRAPALTSAHLETL